MISIIYSGLYAAKIKLQIKTQPGFKSKKENMGNMYVQIAIEINREQTAKRKFYNSQKNYFSVVYPQKHST